MRFAVLRVRVEVNLFYQMVVEDWCNVAIVQRAARSGGEVSLVMYLKSGGQTWGISATWPALCRLIVTSVGQAPRKCDECILTAQSAKEPDASILAAWGTVRGFRP